MQIQLNTDDHVHGTESMAVWVERELKDKLARFNEQVTRVEVHLSDVNASRVSDADKRCKLEARVAGRQAVAVSHDAATVTESFHGATVKLVRAIDADLGRARDARGRDSIRGETDDEGE